MTYGIDEPVPKYRPVLSLTDIRRKYDNQLTKFIEVIRSKVKDKEVIDSSQNVIMAQEAYIAALHKLYMDGEVSKRELAVQNQILRDQLTAIG